MAILRSLVHEGYRWIVWNRHMDVSALGRQLFHHAQLHKAYGLAFAAADLEMEGFPRQGNPLVGHKHFGCSDYTVHRSREWMATVKMSSQRVVGTELINEDNLLGYYLGDGATFYYRRGDEYLDVFLLWDWRKVPGVTTSIDQRVQSGELAVWTDGRWRHVGEKEGLCRQDLRFFHDARGYVVLGKDTVVAEADRRSGRWCDCMGMYRPATIEGEVVSLHLRHGSCPQGAGYQYIVLPACNREEVERFDVSKEVRVLRNDAVAQVVQVPSMGSGFWMAVYRSQPLEMDGREFCPSAPGVYYVEASGEVWKVSGASFGQEESCCQ